MMVQIPKAMYGLVQLAALWYGALLAFLRSLQFVPNPLNNCVLMLRTNAGVLLIIL